MLPCRSDPVPDSCRQMSWQSVVPGPVFSGCNPPASTQSDSIFFPVVFKADVKAIKVPTLNCVVFWKLFFQLLGEQTDSAT